MHGMLPMGKLVNAIGLMSGTSLDGIDVALVRTDGEAVVERGRNRTVPYSEAFRQKLREGLQEATTITERAQRPGRLRLLEQYLTDLHVEAVQQFCEDQLLEAGEIDVIGFHGQTVLHKPATGLTVQLGDGKRLAELTGIDVVYDLRAADMAAGGQGAPLVPAYHQALVAKLPQQPVVLVNIGGVANITYIGRDGRLIAFDTGPGNAMLDDWMMRKTGHTHDPDGRVAAQGVVRQDYVAEYLKHSYFASPPPKSLDRNAFAWQLVSQLPLTDGAATLTAFAAEAIARARRHLPEEPQLWIVSGGGRKNKTLMSMIAGLVQNAVVPAEAVGLDGDLLEAEAFGYLAVRSLYGLPLTFPGTTGVSEPISGGVLARA